MSKQRVNFYFKGACLNKVKAIKCIRGITYMGLKEAKNEVERAEREIVTVDFIENEHYSFDDVKRIIEECDGICDFGNFEKYTESIREVATAATLAGDYYVAKRLIEFLEKNF